MASSTAFQDVGGTRWIVGHSTTRAPSSSSPARNSADCEAVRVMTTVLPLSGILGDLGKDFSGSHRKKLLTEFNAERGGIAGWARNFIANDASSIEAGDQALDHEPAGFQPG